MDKENRQGLIKSLLNELPKSKLIEFALRGEIEIPLNMYEKFKPLIIEEEVYYEKGMYVASRIATSYTCCKVDQFWSELEITDTGPGLPVLYKSNVKKYAIENGYAIPIA
jgi:hypothetical protein